VAVPAQRPLLALQFLRALLFTVWGLSPQHDPPPRVLIERGSD
jgi:hypothetical protein